MDASLKSLIHTSFEEHRDLHTDALQALAAPLEKTIALCLESLRAGGTIFWCGNGGSAADAQHMAAELVGRYKKERRAIRSIALTSNTSTLTAISNDYSYDRIFDRQLEALGTPKDVLIAISTSGGSPNILRALDQAHAIGMKTIGLTGGNPENKMAPKCNVLLAVPTRHTPRIQEYHLLVEHILCEAIENGLETQ